MMMMSSGGAGEDQGRPAVGVDVAVRARSSCKECVIPIHIYMCIRYTYICVYTSTQRFVQGMTYERERERL